MLYDVLREYRRYLETKYSRETARTYSIRLCTILKGQNMTDIENRLDLEKILANLSTIRHKNYFSQAKNAFLHYCEFQNITLPAGAAEIINELENDTRKKYRNLQAVDYRQVEKAIQNLKNKKLRVCYQTIIATGLRVSELADITPGDCLFSEDTITFEFTAKGGDRERVMLDRGAYSELYRNIHELWTSTPPDKKLFYSAIHLQTNAKRHGFTCHDLRRAYAKLEYKKSRSKTEVMKRLRHSSLKNTNIYLRSKVKI